MVGRYKRPTVPLIFEDDQFDGLEVEVRRASNNKLFDIMESAERLSELDAENAPVSEMRKALAELAAELAPVIARWNLDDENDRPIPPTAEGLMNVDPALLLALAGAVQQTMGGVSAPLAPSSDDGPRSLAELEPMG